MEYNCFLKKCYRTYHYHTDMNLEGWKVQSWKSEAAVRMMKEKSCRQYQINHSFHQRTLNSIQASS